MNMKKAYITPVILTMRTVPMQMLCGSVTGVSGTGNLNTDVDKSGGTDEYLSRRNQSLWDEDEEE